MTEEESKFESPSPPWHDFSNSVDAQDGIEVSLCVLVLEARHFFFLFLLFFYSFLLFFPGTVNCSYVLKAKDKDSWFVPARAKIASWVRFE